MVYLIISTVLVLVRKAEAHLQNKRYIPAVRKEPYIYALKIAIGQELVQEDDGHGVMSSNDDRLVDQKIPMPSRYPRTADPSCITREASLVMTVLVWMC